MMNSSKVQEVPKTPIRTITTEQGTKGLQFGLKGYVPTSQIIPMVDCSVAEYKVENRKIVKSCAKKYIRANIPESSLARFMLKSIRYEHMDFLVSDNIVYNLSDYEESEYITSLFSTKIRENERWFYDLMLYLEGKYTDGQLLNADFFRVVQNGRAKRTFVKNTQSIDLLTKYKARYAQKLFNENQSKIAKASLESQRKK